MRDLDPHGNGMTAMEELEMVDMQVELAGFDEEATMFDPNEHPKRPHPDEEAVTDVNGEREVDIMDDTPAIDPLADFDLREDELLAVDVL